MVMWQGIGQCVPLSGPFSSCQKVKQPASQGVPPWINEPYNLNLIYFVGHSGLYWGTVLWLVMMARLYTPYRPLIPVHYATDPRFMLACTRDVSTSPILPDVLYLQYGTGDNNMWNAVTCITCAIGLICWLFISICVFDPLYLLWWTVNTHDIGGSIHAFTTWSGRSAATGIRLIVSVPPWYCIFI